MIVANTFWLEQEMITVHQTSHHQKEIRASLGVWRWKYLDQCNRIQFSSPLQSITASLSSAFDSGAHPVLIFSVVVYHYRGYTTGVRVRVAK